MWPLKKEPVPEKQPEITNPPPTAPTADDLVAKLSASLTEQLKPLTETVNRIDSEWKSMKESATRPPAKTDGERTAPASVFDNEDAAFQERLGPVYARQIETDAKMTERDVLAEFSDWSEFLPEIRDTLQKTPWQVKAAPNYDQYVRNVVKMVVGAKALTSGVRFDGKGKKFFLEDASSKGDGSQPPSDDKGLSAKQLHAISKWGMKAEDYIAAQKRLEVVS